MLVRIEGRLIDGSQLADGTSAAGHGQQDLDDDALGSIPAGVDLVIEAALTKQDETALDLAAYTGRLVVRASNSTLQIVANIAGVTFGAAANGLMRFSIPAATLKPLLGQYVYNVVVSAAGLIDEVVPNSNLEVRAASAANT